MDALQMFLGLNKQNNPPKPQSILGPTPPIQTDDTPKYEALLKALGVLQTPAKTITSATGIETEDPTDETTKLTKLFQIFRQV